MRDYPRVSWGDPRCEVHDAPGKGKGVYATAPIRQGEVVQIVGGAIVNGPQLEAAMAAATDYVNTIQIDEDLHLIMDLPRDARSNICSMNHSCDSNIWMADEITFIARKDIAPGEEVTVDYALFSTSPDPETVLEAPCRCRSSFCRGRITGDDWQLLHVQERYKGHFAPFINRRIARIARH
ncbi:MAG: SET domain-containing protein [Chloroflexia bacterium]